MKLWGWTTIALSLLIAGIGLYYALFVYADEAEARRTVSELRYGY